MDVGTAINFLRNKVGKTPDIGIICGSGLGGLADTLQGPGLVTLHYSEIPGFAVSTVKGHAGKLVFGWIGKKFVVCMQGRYHFYEGHKPAKVAFPVKVMSALGIRFLVVTNAAGGLNREFNVGDIMILRDHISFLGFAGQNPLCGKNDERFGPRFPPCNAYNKELQQYFRKCATMTNFKPIIREGVYIGLSGPNYETPAEVNACRVLGADAVGMSTVFEVQTAAHSSLPVLGVSIITNRCKGPGDSWPDPYHGEVLEATRKVENELQRLVSCFVTEVDISPYPRSRAFDHFAKAKL